MTDATPPAPLLEVTDLVKHYRMRRGALSGGKPRVVPAVDGVSLRVYAGQTLAVVGESGCGKSTLAKLVMRIEQPDAGDIRFGGTPIADMPTHQFRQQVQMVFQDPFGSLTPHLRVGALIREPLVIHKTCPVAEMEQRVMQGLAAVGLSPDIAMRFPHELSGGQRQRVGIARGIATQPHLLICDEPVSALDVSIRSQIINLLLDLQHSRGLAYLFISHDLGLVNHISDQVCVMYLGKVVEYASAQSFFADPRHPYARALIASSPVPDPRRRGRPAAMTGEIAARASDERGCSFRGRCPMAIDRCASDDPALRAIVPGHLVACHRAEETAPG